VRVVHKPQIQRRCTPSAKIAATTAVTAGILAMDTAIGEELRLAGNDQIRIVSVLPWAVDMPQWGHMASDSGGTARIEGDIRARMARERASQPDR